MTIPSWKVAQNLDMVRMYVFERKPAHRLWPEWVVSGGGGPEGGPHALEVGKDKLRKRLDSKVAE